MAPLLTVPERIVTPRLVLRKPTLDDASEIFRSYAQDKDVPRYTTWRVHKSDDDTQAYLALCLDEWDRGESFVFALEDPGRPGQPFGTIHMRRHPNQMLFGYVLARRKWGSGLATEALSCLVDWTLSQPGIWRAAAYCDIDNRASARVMEKAGMAFEGILRRYCVHPNISDAPRDCRMYAKVI